MSEGTCTTPLESTTLAVPQPPNMTKEELDALWRDPKHWRNWNTTYTCTDDPRYIVPPRVWWSGYVGNWAHPRAALALLGLSILIAIGPFGVLLATGTLTVASALGALVASIAALTWMALYFSTRTE